VPVGAADLAGEEDAARSDPSSGYPSIYFPSFFLSRATLRGAAVAQWPIGGGVGGSAAASPLAGACAHREVDAPPSSGLEVVPFTAEPEAWPRRSAVFHFPARWRLR
jgi:hypothetical protein